MTTLLPGFITEEEYEAQNKTYLKQVQHKQASVLDKKPKPNGVNKRVSKERAKEKDAKRSLMAAMLLTSFANDAGGALLWEQ